MPRYPFDLIVLDLETTGRPDDRILEIGAVRLNDDLEIQDSFQVLVDGSPIPEAVIKVHGITEELVAGAPDFGEAYAPFVEWCERSPAYVLAAWPTSYEIPVLKAEYKRFGLKYPHPWQSMDIKSIVWDRAIELGHLTRRMSVDRGLDIFGLAVEGRRHRALPDAIMEAKLLIKAKSK